MEGYKAVWVRDACYEKLLDRVRPKPGALAQQQGYGCISGVIVDGDNQYVVCLGGLCPWYKRIFGGECVEGRNGQCRCSWGVLDPILGRIL